MKRSMEQRRTRRFQLELPLSITRSGAARVTLAGRTKNISSAGVLFTSGNPPDLGASIEYIITLIHEPVRPVMLRCVGKVVRMSRANTGEDRNVEIAATLERYEFMRETTRAAGRI